DAKRDGDRAPRVAMVELCLVLLTVAEGGPQHPSHHDDEQQDDEEAGLVDEVVDPPTVGGRVVRHPQAVAFERSGDDAQERHSGPQESALRTARHTRAATTNGTASRASTASAAELERGRSAQSGQRRRSAKEEIMRASSRSPR